MANSVRPVVNMKKLFNLPKGAEFNARKGVSNQTNKAIQIVDHASAFYYCHSNKKDCIDEDDCVRVDLPHDGVFVITDTPPRWLSGDRYDWETYPRHKMFEIVDLTTHKRYWLGQFSFVHYMTYVTIKQELPAHIGS